ncbi:hypothetical protein U91I_00792 [alpha proteobacterium U9-1i]|nr:hypothetical protein U91I_00792 [alpha proteobacterium U9-1i]
MQGPIAQALALVAVGNASLNDRDVTGFWPNASVFRFSKICEFLAPSPTDDDAWLPVAQNPIEWFDRLKPWCVGLRLHVAPRAPQPGQSLLNERMSVGFVGGGPRWLIEAAGKDSAQIWQGFDRLLDRADPQQKIWANGYLLQGETEPQTLSADPLPLALAEFALVLEEIEQLARELHAENFAHCFVEAREALKSAPPPAGFYDDIAEYAGLDADARRALVAASSAWVFGGMGSWNDIGAPEALSARYERQSEALFQVLQRVIAAIANATYRG